MTACVGWCPQPENCEQWGGCIYEAEMHEQARQDAAYAAAMDEQYAEHMAEMEREHYQQEHGGCGAHASPDLTCSDCLVAFRVVGLL